MKYAELRRGQLFYHNDTVYTKVNDYQAINGKLGFAVIEADRDVVVYQVYQEQESPINWLTISVALLPATMLVFVLGGFLCR